MKQIGTPILVSKLGKQFYSAVLMLTEVYDVFWFVVTACIAALSNYVYCFSMTEILESLPKQRRTGLFSATQAKEMEEIVKFGLRLLS